MNDALLEKERDQLANALERLADVHRELAEGQRSLMTGAPSFLACAQLMHVHRLMPLLPSQTCINAMAVQSFLTDKATPVLVCRCIGWH